MVYLITGKAGAGKTCYARRLCDELKERGARVYLLDGDEFRKATNNNDYTDEGRRRNLMNAAQIACKAERDGFMVILSFVAPTKMLREEMRSLWCQSRLVYLPGGKLWPGTVYEMPDEDELDGRNYRRDRQFSLFIGRYQPFHAGHEELVRTVLDEGKNVCIACRDTKISSSDPHSYAKRKQMIEQRFPQEVAMGRVAVIQIPDIEDVCYGRKVGWGIREIHLSQEVEAISATIIRETSK